VDPYVLFASVFRANGCDCSVMFSCGRIVSALLSMDVCSIRCPPSGAQGRGTRGRKGGGLVRDNICVSCCNDSSLDSLRVEDTTFLANDNAVVDIVHFCILSFFFFFSNAVVTSNHDTMLYYCCTALTTGLDPFQIMQGHDDY